MSTAPNDFSALIGLHRLEIGELEATVASYRALLEEHGITPPDDAGAAFLSEWRACREVIETAYEFVSAVERFRDRLGPARELLAERWR